MVSRLSRDTEVKGPNSANGGNHVSHTDAGSRQFEFPTLFPAPVVVAYGGATDPGASGAEQIARRLHGNWGDSSARRLKRVPADAEGGNQQLSVRILRPLGSHRDYNPQGFGEG